MKNENANVEVYEKKVKMHDENYSGFSTVSFGISVKNDGASNCRQ